MACLKKLVTFRSLLTTLIPSRGISYTSSVSAKAKHGNVLKKANKFLERRVTETKRNRKKQWYDTPMGISAAGSFGVAKKGPSQGSQRRAHQLSVVLSQYVISLIESGELHPELPELGVQVVKVKLSTDLSALHIYWLATGTQTDDEIQTILLEAGYKLRTMLTGLGLMTGVPPVVFIKDLSQARLDKVQELLERADMGPDHEPTDLAADMKSDITLPGVDTMSQSTLQDQLESVKTSLSLRDLETSDTVQKVPVISRDQDGTVDTMLNLRSDIYDVDHGGLTQKVLQLKRQKTNRYLQITETSQSEGLKVMSQVSKRDIQKFLATRKVKERRPNAQRMLNSELYRTNESELADGNDFIEDNYDDEDVDDDDMYRK